MEITLPVRSYDAARPGWVEEAFRLDVRQTAFVELHCWNIGMPGGIAVPEEHWVFMGSPQNHRAAAQILYEQIAPALAAARHIGMAIVHVQPENIARRYPQCAPPMPERAVTTPEPVPISDHEAKRQERVHGEGFAQWLQREDIDVAQAVRPQAGDVMIVSTDQFEEWLRANDIKTLIYTGFAANLCILDSPAAMKAMAARGCRCVLLREATLAVEFPDTLAERVNTQAAVRYVEAWVGYSASVTDFLCVSETV